MSFPYYFGAPLWALKEWRGHFFTVDAKPAEFLQQYAQYFTAVEGNTTFYSVPSEAMVQRWLESTPATFRFSFKFPRQITHASLLQSCDTDVRHFLQRLSPLEERLNGFMLQLPASFSPVMLPVLERFLDSLPQDYTYAVEVRHPDFFTNKSCRAQLNATLSKRGVDRVIFESRPVHAAPAIDQATREAHERKPRLPVQLDVTGLSPVLRYIGHPVFKDNEQYLKPWVAQTERWIESGLTPRIFLHTPDNVLVPELMQQFHQGLQQRIDNLNDLPVMPAARQSGFLF